ncbi:Fungalysin metallopeptidase-domain-containing protein [Thamnocephalis sphaerospora]|uniref:Extracellular metalloproteinase n=1 Tax=Thamnocephalis sphaerospora TaxID=78915 RepID=A0A4P9XWJ3_9FUNG|nr:Fungalysin metallopeptidase-domain-containing protein [Thamnocephalis sphaerospora]|eukprot:RKP10694.1 Fungalysin metallopeptidase-domain-containing protein [Thamnocephalis sphaerospora]
MVTDAYQSSNHVAHVYFRQLLDGVPILNGNAAVHVDAQGQIVAFSSSFQKAPIPPYNASAPSQPAEAFKVIDRLFRHASNSAASTSSHKTRVRRATIDDVPYATGPVTAAFAYLHLDASRTVPIWAFNLPTLSNYYHIQVAATGERILALSSWTYNAQNSTDPMGPLCAPKSGMPCPASAPGTKDLTCTLYMTTVGNNVYAQENWINRTMSTQRENLTLAGDRPSGGPSLTFDFPFNASAEPLENQNASTTNLFYLINYMHDLFYAYGFDEAAGNFQEFNFDRGGLGGDALIADSLDTGGENNADMTVPPDGERPRLRVHLYNYTQPDRDAAFANDVVVHEYTHGLTARLTGGPSNVDCLVQDEDLGLAEGWSDFVALWLQAAAHTIEENAANTTRNATVGNRLRLYDYSTDTTYNPTNYSLVNDAYWRDAHRLGMIWAMMLYEMYWELVDNYGFTPDLTSADTTKGNTLALQLVVDGLKLQPCRPTFISARDAILLADRLSTDGLHQCAIWRAFARRGLGVNAGPIMAFNRSATDAESSTVASDAVPEECADSAGASSSATSAR